MNVFCKLVLISAVALFAGKIIAAENVLTVAVFDFETGDEGMRKEGQQVADLIRANLSAEPNLVMVERADLEKVLSEQELGLSGTVTTDSAAQVGNLTGAKVLVIGRVFKVDAEQILVAKIIGAETSRVYGEMVKGSETATVSDLAEQLAKKIAADVSQKSDTLVARVTSREERVAGLKSALAGKKLPVVSVKISERHFGQHVIDPAAQTELSLILQQCGFVVVDAVSTNSPDVKIDGEAFSAFGLRKGNLVSCTARIELKAHNRNGDLIWVDRQMAVAADIAEQTAAKKALETAADNLAARVLPKLAK